MKRITVLFMCFIVLCALFPVVLYSKDTVKIAMGYIPNVQFAPYYIALEKGYFQQEGIAVALDYGMSTDIMSLVGGGQIEFGISDGDQVIIARDRGIPVKVVYSMYVKYPVAIVSFKEKGITRVRSLVGKRVGTPGPYGSNYFGLKIMLNHEGLSYEDVDLKFIGYTQIESLIADRVDAAVVFINNEPIVLREMGKEINVLDTYSITPMVSASIITGDHLIEKDPELVRKFIRAVVKGSRYVIDHQDEVILLLKNYIPTLTEHNLDINKKVLRASLELWMDEDTAIHGIGYTTKSDWECSIDEMYNLGLIRRRISPADCYTNRFIGN